MRLPVLILALSLSLPAAAQTPLAEALDGAWARDPRARAFPQREAAQRARADAAESLFPEPPALGLGVRSDQYDRNAGAREHEVELALPLWLPGQRQARREAASAGRDSVSGVGLALRLELAGQVREAVWAVRLEDTARELAQRRLDLAVELEKDVARRVKAGELARLDLNTARGERFASEAEALRAAQSLAQARSVWRLLTGLDAVPAGAEEQPATATPDPHPRVHAQRLLAGGAMANLSAVRASRRSAPEVALLARQDRALSNDPYAQTIGVRVRIPFVLDGRAAQSLAEANAVVIEAEALAEREALAVEAEIRQRAAELDTAHQTRALSAQALESAEDSHQLAEKAFRLGELDLPALLRIRSAAQAARLAAARGGIEWHRAVARLNQALGVLP